MAAKHQNAERGRNDQDGRGGCQDQCQAAVRSARRCRNASGRGRFRLPPAGVRSLAHPKCRPPE